MPKKLVGKFPCVFEDCDSSDALSIWEDSKGLNGYCFSCQRYVPERLLNQENVKEEAQEERPRRPLREVLKEIKETYPTGELTDRGISAQVAKRYGVRLGLSEEDGKTITHHYYPYYKSGKLVAYKERDVANKKFDGIGPLGGVQLFGQHLAGDKGKLLIITEGECDAMAAYQMLLSLGKNYRVVSVPSGGNVKAIQDNLEWIENFENVIFAFDQDDHGRKAAREACEVLSIGKGRVMEMTEKDPNDMLRKNKAREFFNSISEAQQAKPDGIVSGIETWDLLQNRPRVECVYYPQDWVEMNALTYGMRLGELDTWTSGTGMGKTQVMKELLYHLLQTTDDNIGVIFLEEPLEDTVEALMGLHLNKRIHLPDVVDEVTEEEKYEAWKATSGTGRLHFANSWAEEGGGNLLSKIRYFAKGLNCKRIFLDHLHMITEDDHTNEVTHIDRLMSRIKKLTRELHIWIGLVVHLRKAQNNGKSFEQGEVPTLDDLRGSSSIKQLSNSVYALARNQQHPDEDIRNTTNLHVLKCRFTGRTGPAGQLQFDPITGRMYSVERNVPENIQVFKGNNDELEDEISI